MVTNLTYMGYNPSDNWQYNPIWVFETFYPSFFRLAPIQPPTFPSGPQWGSADFCQLRDAGDRLEKRTPTNVMKLVFLEGIRTSWEIPLLCLVVWGKNLKKVANNKIFPNEGCLKRTYTRPLTNIVPEKRMVGRRSFPLGFRLGLFSGANC